MITKQLRTEIFGEFVQAAVPLAHDCSIVRLAVNGAVQTLVVMLQPEAWRQINGDTTPVP